MAYSNVVNFPYESKTILNKYESIINNNIKIIEDTLNKTYDPFLKECVEEMLKREKNKFKSPPKEIVIKTLQKFMKREMINFRPETMKLQYLLNSWDYKLCGSRALNLVTNHSDYNYVTTDISMHDFFIKHIYPIFVEKYKCVYGSKPIEYIKNGVTGSFDQKTYTINYVEKILSLHEQKKLHYLKHYDKLGLEDIC